jgi:hypothetical protein
MDAQTGRSAATHFRNGPSSSGTSDRSRSGSSLMRRSNCQPISITERRACRIAALAAAK